MEHLWNTAETISKRAIGLLLYVLQYCPPPYPNIKHHTLRGWTLTDQLHVENSNE